jgi:protein-tyrosine phosphatase
MHDADDTLAGRPPGDGAAEAAAAAIAGAAAVRTAAGGFELSWETRGEPGAVDIFHGESPEEIDRSRPLARASGRRALLEGLCAGRAHYFELAPERGRPLLVGERRIDAEGSANLRDLGGYATEDGRTVRWGSLFRSDNLARLTDAGLARVRGLRLRTVVDFRTDSEVRRLPNRFPAPGEADYLRLPIQHGEFEPTAVFERIQRGDYDWISEAFMIAGYIDNVERHTAVWSRFFALAADARRRPLLFHCTGGKDRTGVGAALLLLALGVPVETVVADYGLSDPYIAEVRARIFAQIRAGGVDTDKVAPYFTAPPSRLRALLDHLRRKHGSAVDYLRKAAGVGGDLFRALKRELLVPRG